MKWNKYDIETLTQATDIICAELLALGISGVEIKDKIQPPREELGGMFTEVIPEAQKDDGKALITFYLDDTDKEGNILKLNQLKSRLSELSEIFDIGSARIYSDTTDDEDWANNWKKYWHSFRINDLLIKPTWEDIPEDAAECRVLSLDPGTAFGTGSHETTRLVIGILQKLIKPGINIMDIGCGSGILSIVSVMYGADFALGIDLDPNAIKASYANAAENNIPKENVRFTLGNLIADEDFRRECGYEKYDIVCANILPDVLIPLSEIVSLHMKKGAYLIYSGILTEKLDSVLHALENKFEIKETLSDGEWSAILAYKN